MNFRGPFVSAPSVLGLPAFIWVVGIWTQVLMPFQQAFDFLDHPCGPLVYNYLEKATKHSLLHTCGLTFPSFSVCACVFLFVCIVSYGGQNTTSGVRLLFASCLRQGLLFASEYTRITAHNSVDSPISAPGLAVGTLGWQQTLPSPAFLGSGDQNASPHELSPALLSF